MRSRNSDLSPRRRRTEHGVLGPEDISLGLFMPHRSAVEAITVPSRAETLARSRRRSHVVPSSRMRSWLKLSSRTPMRKRATGKNRITMREDPRQIVLAVILRGMIVIVVIVSANVHDRTTWNDRSPGRAVRVLGRVRWGDGRANGPGFFFARDGDARTMTSAMTAMPPTSTGTWNCFTERNPICRSYIRIATAPNRPTTKIVSNCSTK